MVAVLVACAMVRSSASFSGKSAMNLVKRSRDSTQKSESALVRSVADLRMFCCMPRGPCCVLVTQASEPAAVSCAAQHRRADWEYSDARRTVA